MNKPLIATILALGFLALVPPADATTPCDGTFESNAIFDIPDSCNGWAQSGSGDVSVQANPVVDATNPSDQVLRTNGPSFMFDIGDRCTGTVNFDLLSDTAVAGISAVISTHTLVTGGAAAELAMGIGMSGTTVSMSYDNNIAGAGSTVAFGPAFTFAANTWYHFHYECNNQAPRLRVTVTGGTSTAASVSQGIGDDPTPYSQKYLRFARSSGSLYVDNLEINLASSSRNVFCANVADSYGRFGYNYKEGVNFQDQDFLNAEEIGLTDFFYFGGSSTNFEYLAKSSDGSGSTFVETKFTIEAAEENQASIFRVSYSFVDPSSYVIGTGPSAYLNGPNDVGDDAKGDGLTTEMFADQVEVEFRETANTWVVQLYETNGGTRQLYGQAVSITSPNDFQGFSFVVNTVADYIAVEDDQGVSFINKTMSGLGGTYSGDAVRTQWFVGYGTDAGTSLTALNDNDGDFHSTCIYALDAWDNLGTDGTTDTVIGNTTTNTETGIGGSLLGGAVVGLPTGWTVTAFNGFLGLLLMGAVGTGLFFAMGRSPIAAGAGAVVGFLMSYFFGLFELWVILFVALIAIAAGVFKFRGMASGG